MIISPGIFFSLLVILALFKQIKIVPKPDLPEQFRHYEKHYTPTGVSDVIILAALGANAVEANAGNMTSMLSTAYPISK